MVTYHGRCHCGSVKFTFEHSPISKGLRCNCSMCARKGAMMTPDIVAPEAMKIDAKEGALGLYQFGSEVARHYFCKECGIYTFNETLRKPGYFRVNLGCVDGVESWNMDADTFDGRNLL